jgi:hypothetical protein
MPVMGHLVVGGEGLVLFYYNSESVEEFITAFLKIPIIKIPLHAIYAWGKTDAYGSVQSATDSRVSIRQRMK